MSLREVMHMLCRREYAPGLGTPLDVARLQDVRIITMPPEYAMDIAHEVSLDGFAPLLWIKKGSTQPLPCCKAWSLIMQFKSTYAVHTCSFHPSDTHIHGHVPSGCDRKILVHCRHVSLHTVLCEALLLHGMPQQLCHYMVMWAQVDCAYCLWFVSQTASFMQVASESESALRQYCDTASTRGLHSLIPSRACSNAPTTQLSTAIAYGPYACVSAQLACLSQVRPKPELLLFRSVAGVFAS